ncbi:MAG: chemotaxis protein CheW [Actinomycetota bacterium]
MTAPDSATRQMCTCKVGPLLIGLDVVNIREILYYSEQTKVPRTGPAVSGLINLRGQIATTIDLRIRLGVEPSPDSELVHVVVRYRDEPVSLLVDEVGEVIHVDRSRYEPPPDNVGGQVRELLTGAYKLDGELLLTLDIDKTISTSNTPMSAATLGAL